jgi:hypothetical protein
MGRLIAPAALLALVAGMGGCGGPKDKIPTELRKAPDKPPIGAKVPGGTNEPGPPKEGASGSSAQ